jgi:hypothetical protein
LILQIVARCARSAALIRARARGRVWLHMIFQHHFFIEGYKLIDFANRCALRKICRPDPRSGAGARMVTTDENFIEIKFQWSRQRWHKIPKTAWKLVVDIT